MVAGEGWMERDGGRHWRGMEAGEGGIDGEGWREAWEGGMEGDGGRQGGRQRESIQRPVMETNS